MHVLYCVLSVFGNIIVFATCTILERTAMNIFKLTGLFLIFALLLSFVGCGGNAGKVISEDLRQDILESTDGISSYLFEGSMAMSSTDNPELNISFDYSGAIDLENSNMSMTASGETEESSMEMERYLLTDVLYFGSQSNAFYTQMEVDGVSNGWTTWEAPYSEWEEQDQLALQLETLSFAEVKHSGSETLEGTDCYVLDIVLDEDELVDFAMQQPTVADLLQGFGTEGLGTMVEEMTVKEWVAKDTNRPVKAQMTFSFTIQEVTVNIDTVMRFYDYNSPLNIILPEECTAWLAQENRTAVIETSMGTIEIELYEKRVPVTTANFISLAEDGFYDGLIFYRVIDDFMIQGGDPSGDGTGGSDETIDLEIHPDLKHIDGAISMARSADPNSASSQFFICDGAQAHLDGQYAVFGVVTDGIEFVQAIAAVDTDEDTNKPLADVVITTITIE